MAAISASDEVLLIAMPTSTSIADVLKAKIISQRLGSKPIGILINFVRGEKGEIKKDDIMKMLELPVFATVPYDDDLRRSAMQESPKPIMLTKPNSPAAAGIQKAAAKLAGLPMAAEASGKGFFSRLLGFFFRKKPKEGGYQA